MNIDASLCSHERDADWNISWPVATSGDVVQQKCPGGAESLGMCCSLIIIIYVHAKYFLDKVRT